MARVALSAVALDHAGTNPETGATTPTVDGFSYPNQPDLALWVKNANGSSITVTFQTPYTKDGLALADNSQTVLNATTELVAMHADEIYTQSDGNVYVDITPQSGVSARLLRV